MLFVFINPAFSDYNEDALEYLFTSKHQRKTIDDKRLGRHTDSGKKNVTDKVTISGYMKRSNGKSVVWVNGKSTLNKHSVEDITINPSSIKDNQVTVSVKGKRKRLKPGESWRPPSDSGISVSPN